MTKEDEIKNLENYLSDFDNLMETDHFSKIDISDYVFHHKELNLKEFLIKGREAIRLYLISVQGQNK